MIKRCDACLHYQFPPEHSMNRADIGYCDLYKSASIESDSCGYWHIKGDD